MAQVSRSRPSRDQVRVQRKEVSPVGLRKEGLGMQEEEGTGQQGHVKHLSGPLPLEGAEQEWLGGLGPGERQAKAQQLGKWDPCRERIGKVSLLGLSSGTGRKLGATISLGQGPLGLTMTA